MVKLGLKMSVLTRQIEWYACGTNRSHRKEARADFQKNKPPRQLFFFLFLPYLKKLGPDLAQILHECFKQSYASEKYTPTHSFIDTLDFSFFNLIFFDFFFLFWP